MAKGFAARGRLTPPLHPPGATGGDTPRRTHRWAAEGARETKWTQPVPGEK